MRDALTTAREWGAQPLDILGVPSRPWSEANRFLAMALTLHDKDLCPGGCGQYLDETIDSDDHSSYYDVERFTCLACEARDQDEAKPKPGELIAVRLVKRD